MRACCTSACTPPSANTLHRVVSHLHRRTFPDAPRLKPYAPWWVLINPFAWILWLLDFVVWLLLPCPLLGPIKMIIFLVKSMSMSSTKVDDKLYTRRRAGHEAAPTTEPYPGCNTAYSIMQRSFEKFASQNCMGTRKFLGWYKGEKMRFPIKKFGATSWQSYAEVGERAANFGKGLKALGMESCPAGMTTDSYQESNGAHTMLIFEETCPQWMTGLMGAHTQSLVVATSYSTLGISAVIEAVNETQCAVILCNLTNLEKIKAAAGDAPSLKAIVYSCNYVTDADIPEDAEISNGPGPKVLSVDAVINLGKDSASIAATPPEPAMPAVVMYTSGSTGKPKGVMIPHKSIAASVSGILGILMNTPGMPEGKQVTRMPRTDAAIDWCRIVAPPPCHDRFRPHNARTDTGTGTDTAAPRALSLPNPHRSLTHPTHANPRQPCTFRPTWRTCRPRTSSSSAPSSPTLPTALLSATRTRRPSPRLAPSAKSRTARSATIRSTPCTRRAASASSSRPCSRRFRRSGTS